MNNAAFFARQAIAGGKKPSAQDLGPDGKVKSAFGNLANPQPGSSRAGRAKGAAYMPQTRMQMLTGQRPRKRIMGVDAQQSAEMQDKFDHRNDEFFAQANAARQADPTRPHQTPAQFKASQMASGAGDPDASKRAPGTPIDVSAGGGDGGSDPTPGKSTPAPKGPYIRQYTGNSRPEGPNGPVDATDPPAPPKGPGKLLPTSPGVDPVPTSRKTADASDDSPFGGLAMTRKKKPAEDDGEDVV